MDDAELAGEDASTEGEFVLDLGSLDSAAPREGPGRPVEKTRALLAYLLFGLFAVVELTLLTLLAFRRLDVSQFSQITGVAITPIVGLLGAATGYYYGRGSR